MTGKKVSIQYCQHDFYLRVWQVLAAVPYGRIVTYGDLAILAGAPRAARQVGAVLKRLPKESSLPWHRVINSRGKISLTGSAGKRQRTALMAEGIVVTAQGKVSLARYRWRL